MAVDITPQDGNEHMAIDDTVSKLADQDFAAGMASLRNGFSAAAVRHNNAANAIHDSSLLTHQSTQQLVGAKAAGQLDRDSIAKSILDGRAAAGQPSNAPDANK